MVSGLYGLEGMPMPWYNHTRIVSSNNSKTYELNDVADKLTSQLQSWCYTFMGVVPNSEMLKNNGRHIQHQEDLDKIWEEKLAEKFSPRNWRSMKADGSTMVLKKLM